MAEFFLTQEQMKKAMVLRGTSCTIVIVDYNRKPEELGDVLRDAAHTYEAARRAGLMRWSQ